MFPAHTAHARLTFGFINHKHCVAGCCVQLYSWRLPLQKAGMRTLTPCVYPTLPTAPWVSERLEIDHAEVLFTLEDAWYGWAFNDRSDFGVNMKRGLY